MKAEAPKYDIGSMVPLGGEMGKVIDIVYSYRYQEYKYVISISYNETYTLLEDEIGD